MVDVAAWVALAWPMACQKKKAASYTMQEECKSPIGLGNLCLLSKGKLPANRWEFADST